MRTLMVLLSLLLASTAAAAFGSRKYVTVAEKLQAQYATLRMADRTTVAQLGTVLSLQKAGIMASPAGEPLPYSNTYKNGRITHGLGKALLHNPYALRELEAGEKVYVIKFDVKDPHVTFHVQTCNACDGSIADFMGAYRAEINLPFAKGFLASATLDQVQKEIAELFAIAPPGAVMATSPANPEPVAPAATEEAPAMPPMEAPPASAEPLKIELGESMDQVLSAMGQPDKVIDLGNKKIYLYKDFKITFVDGKVSDVQ